MAMQADERIESLARAYHAHLGCMRSIQTSSSFQHDALCYHAISTLPARESRLTPTGTSGSQRHIHQYSTTANTDLTTKSAASSELDGLQDAAREQAEIDALKKEAGPLEKGGFLGEP